MQEATRECREGDRKRTLGQIFGKQVVRVGGGIACSESLGIGRVQPSGSTTDVK